MDDAISDGMSKGGGLPRGGVERVRNERVLLTNKKRPQGTTWGREIRRYSPGEAIGTKRGVGTAGKRVTMTNERSSSNRRRDDAWQSHQEMR